MRSSDGHPLTPIELVLARTADEAGGTPAIQRDVLELFGECAPGLRRYVRSSGLAPEAADDVVQEAFLSLFKHLCLSRDRDNLRGWLFRVSHRLALKQRARVTRRQRVEAEWAPHLVDAVMDPAIGPEATLLERQRWRRVCSVIKALPERDRQCLLLACRRASVSGDRGGPGDLARSCRQVARTRGDAVVECAGEVT